MTCPLGEEKFFGIFGGDAMMMAIMDDTHRNGGWCDFDSQRDHIHFICKSRIN